MAKMKSRTKIRISVAIIIVIALVLAAVDFPGPINKTINWANAKWGWQIDEMHTQDFRLGLDLQGGTHLVYEADVSNIEQKERGSALEGVRDVIERRVNNLGVAEPLVQVNRSGDSWRVIVELAGIKDVNEAINMIGETPLLEFKEQNIEKPREMTAEEKAEMKEYNQKAKERANVVLEKAKVEEDFEKLVKEYSEDEETKESGGVLGYISDSGQFKPLYQAAEQTEIGSVHENIVEMQEGFNIIKVLNKQEDEKEIKASHILICYEGASHCDSGLSKEEAKEKLQEIQSEVNLENFADMAAEHSTDVGTKEQGGDLGWFSKDMMVEKFADPAFSLKTGEISDIVETDFGYHLIYKTDERIKPQYEVARILIKQKKEYDYVPPVEEWKNTGLSGKQLKRANVVFDPNTNMPQVSLEFNDEGQELFKEITTRNVGKPVAIFLDGEPISIPTVNEPISDGRAVISGNFNIQEAKILTQRLNAGALPVPINLVSQQTVGATLGQESLSQSLLAGIVGLILVVLFMLIYYRLPGLIAVVALLIYGVIILFLFKYIPVTLTLSGIAGFLLSIGMAVDANVLIFERLKEEVREGKPLDLSVQEGFKRAWPSIRDGNISTLITCLILAWFGTSMIRGFAITLSIGIIVSMFSAIVITRQVLKLFVTPKLQENKKIMWFFGLKRK